MRGILAPRNRLRLVVALAVSWAVVLAVLVTPSVRAGTMGVECRYQRLDAGKWTRHEVRRTIDCFAGKMHVDRSTAFTIAERESGFYYRAYNAAGCGGAGCLGVYQHHASYWGGRVRLADDALDRWNVRRRRWWNPRTQAIVTFVYAKRYGWSAWSTCC